MKRLLIAFILPSVAFAGSVVETFSEYNGAATSSTATWNRITSRLEAPFVIQAATGDVAAQEATDRLISIGTGADGPFNSTTMQSFDEEATVDASILLTSEREYHFTEFTLPAGVTLRASGTQALRIHVQGDVQISGIIDLRGAAGGTSRLLAAAAANGGTAGPGGGAGGSGAGSSFTSSGSSPAIGTAGGGAGAVSLVNLTDGGPGGGGGSAAPGAPGAAGAATPGSEGLAINTPTLSDLRGGAGGGGGGGNSFVGSMGAGGGGGGGALGLFLGGNLSIAATGSILTTGGTGGTATGGHQAGCGGGGGGGSVLIVGAGAVNNDGAIDSQLGAGVCATASGVGSDGTNRFSFDSAFTGAGTETPSIINPATTTYSLAPAVIVSAPYDTLNSFPDYQGVNVVENLNAGDSITYEMAASHDGFVSDATEYVPIAQVGTLSGRRYFRFRITLQSASRTTTPFVDSFEVVFKPGYAFGIAGCARAMPAVPFTAAASWGLVLTYFAGVIFLGRRRRRQPSTEE